MKKKLPVGIQSINEIISSGYVYVDKTAFVEQLIAEGKYYFMSRPRRFGKSLFLSVLKEILGGNRELFIGCQIYSGSYDWQPHPVIYLDFSQIPTSTPDKLEQGLHEVMEKIAKAHGIHIEGSSLQLCLVSLIENLSKKSRVVILVDEYDKPIIDNLSNLDIAEKNRDLLRSFFGTLKGLDDHLKFVFITGVSKFSQVSLFSGFNNLRDITIDPKYSTMMGYTEKEIHHYFHDYVKDIVKERRNTDEHTVFEEIKQWYNGYRFSEQNHPVYNPFSTLNFLITGKSRSYWFRTGTPSFLIEQIRKIPQSATQLSGARATESELLDIRDMRRMDLKALMWQTGYLTIQNYDPHTGLYQLEFPNKEVRTAFFDSLLQEFAEVSPSDVVVHARASKKELETYDLAAFFKRMNGYFAKVPYHLFVGAREGFYHAVFLSLLEGMGITTRAEDPTNIGRIDLFVELQNSIYIFEFKIDKSAEIALEQTLIKKYKEKYSHKNKEIILIGVNFSSQSRNISDWKAERFSPSV